METQGTDPLSLAILVGFIVSLLGVIYRELRDSRDKQLADKDRQIAYRDKQIEKLEAAQTHMAERSASLAGSAERMLSFFIDRETSSPSRSDASSSSEGRPAP